MSLRDRAPAESSSSVLPRRGASLAAARLAAGILVVCAGGCDDLATEPYRLVVRYQPGAYLEPAWPTAQELAPALPCVSRDDPFLQRLGPKCRKSLTIDAGPTEETSEGVTQCVYEGIVVPDPGCSPAGRPLWIERRPLVAALRSGETGGWERPRAAQRSRFDTSSVQRASSICA